MDGKDKNFMRNRKFIIKNFLPTEKEVRKIKKEILGEESNGTSKEKSNLEKNSEEKTAFKMLFF